VGGHRAFWAGASLVWQYARGGWAQLATPVRDFSALRHDTLKQAEATLKKALAEGQQESASSTAKTTTKQEKTGVYKHLLTGVS
jgi:hypothetical protein